MLDFLKQLLDWIYRKNCYICKRPTESGSLCEKCFNEIEISEIGFNQKKYGIDILSGCLYSDNLKSLIRAIKYHNKRDLALPLAKILTEIIKNNDLDADFQIIPVPMHEKRLKERKYNHMNLIGEELALLTNCSINPNFLKRIKDTKPQYKMSMKERKENMRDAFELDINYFENKPVLIIDDICTTGSTLKEITSVLKSNNIKDITAVVIAIPQSTTYYQY